MKNSWALTHLECRNAVFPVDLLVTQEVMGMSVCLFLVVVILYVCVSLKDDPFPEYLQASSALRAQNAGMFLLGFGMEFLLSFGSFLKEIRNWNRAIIYASTLLSLLILRLFVPFISSVLLRGILLMSTVVYQLKSYSYTYVNQILKSSKKDYTQIPKPLLEDLKKNKYPLNVTLKNYVYFLLAPTLCYQPAYPRTKEIRISLVLCSGILVFMSYFCGLILYERVVRSALRFTCLSRFGDYRAYQELLWMCVYAILAVLDVFFGMLQGIYSIIAELTRFGDRKFYGEWWNSRRISDYWSRWNSPVVYFNKSCLGPALKLKFNMGGRGMVASIFAISGILHEIVLGPIFQCSKGLFLIFFLLQIPAIEITTLKLKLFKEPHNTASKIFLSMSFWMEYLAASLFFFATINKACWSHHLQCAGKTPIIPKGTNVLSLLH